MNMNVARKNSGNFKWQIINSPMGHFPMRYNLQYGDGSFPIEINNRLKVETIQPRTIVDIPYKDIILSSLENPEGCPSLSHLASRVESAVLVINGEMDLKITAALLDVLLDSLTTQILAPDNITILYQDLSHNAEQKSILDDLIGPLADLGHPLCLHDPSSSEPFHFVGETPTHSTPVSVNKALTEAELKIGVGTIRANVFTAATGGRMSVIPWAACGKSIERNSKLRATHSVGPYMIDSATCIDLEEASQLAGLDFILNAVPDCNDHIAHIAAGNPYQSWKRSLSIVQNVTDVRIQCKADITIISAGGSKYDCTLYDAVDSLYSACMVTERGGVIILVAECLDGAGPLGFFQGVSECNSESEVSVLSEMGFELGMEKARFFWNVLSSRKVILCSRLRESMVSERLHCLSVRDPQEGLELARSLLVSRPSIAIIDQGSRTIPYLNQ